MVGFLGTLFLIFSVFITTIIIFYAVKKYGKEFIYQSFKKERIDKIENSELFKNPKEL